MKLHQCLLLTYGNALTDVSLGNVWSTVLVLPYCVILYVDTVLSRLSATYMYIQMHGLKSRERDFKAMSNLETHADKNPYP